MSATNLSGKTSPHVSRVTVLGTLNIDHVWLIAQLPEPGQTLLASETRRAFGGKGANQSVAAARQGARVALVGAVGGDADGQRYREHLEREGVDTSAVLVHADAATGAAHVYVDDRGENMVIVDGGANRRWDEEMLTQVLVPLLTRSDVLLTQFEVPVRVVKHALALAAKAGVRSVLNASPWMPDLRWDVPIDTVIVNQHECREFFGMTAEALSRLSAGARADFLRRHQLAHLVVTQGAGATVHFSTDRIDVVPAYPVQPVDTVGAGDTFAGALAVRLGMGRCWEDALQHANIAAALSTLSSGAQSAMPTLPQVEIRLSADQGVFQRD